MSTPLYSYEVTATPSRFFDEDIAQAARGAVQVSENPLQDALEVLYLARIDQYKKDYQHYYTKIHFGSIQRADIYTRLSITIDGVAEIIVFDEELDARLFEIYLLYGWAGILAIESAIQTARSKPATKHTDPWHVVIPFFYFTRNRLILLVRDALIELEKLAAQSIYARLNQTTFAVNTGWNTQFQFKRIEEQVNTREGTLHDTPVMEVKATHTIENRALSDSLYPIMSAAIATRTALNEQIKRKKLLDEQILFYLSEGISPKNLPHSVEVSPAEAQQQIDQFKLELDDLLKQIGMINPLALPAVALLQKDVSQAEMENAIGQSLYDIYQSVDDLAKAIDPQASKLSEFIPGIDLAKQLDATPLEKMYTPGFNLEAAWIDHAFDNAIKQPSHLVLLNQDVLLQLIAGGEITKGSMQHIVGMRYIAILIEKLEAKRVEEERWREVFAVFGKLAAGLSLLSFAAARTPATVGATGILQGVSIALGIPVLLFQIYSLTNQLAKFDQLLKQQLLANNAYDLDFLSSLGDLVALRSEFAEQITETVVKEMLLIFLAKKWGVFKQAMHLRGYYADLEVLLE